MGFVAQKTNIWRWNRNMPAHLKIDGALASSSSRAVVQEVAEGAGFRPETSFGVARVFDNMNFLPPRIVNGWAQSFNALEDQFPHIGAKVTRMGAEDHLAAGRGTSILNGMWTMAPVRGTPGISDDVIDGSLMFDVPDTGRMQMWNQAPGANRRLKQANWQSTGLDDHVFVHEFGHVAHDFVNDWDRVKTSHATHKGQILNVDLMARPFRQPDRAAQIIEEAIQEFAPRGLTIPNTRAGDRVRKAIIRENLSRYAATNWKEAWAEAWAEGYLMGDGARPFAKFVYQRFLEDNDEFLQALARDPNLGGRLDWIVSGVYNPER